MSLPAKQGYEAVSRRLRDLVDTLAGQVNHAPECHAAYVKLGFEPGRVTATGLAMPNGPAYFTSRASLMGQVSAEVAASAFAVFNPDLVVPAVRRGWSLTDASTISAARHAGAVAHLTRLLGPCPDGIERSVELLTRAAETLGAAGKPLFAGARSQPWPDDLMGQLFHLTDRLREFRGDAHTAAWTSAGIDAVEIALVSELYLNLDPRSHSRTRGWTDDQLDAAERSLRRRGWLVDGTLTPEGLAAREAVEAATDGQMAPALDALGDDGTELFRLLEPWSRVVVAAHGFPATLAEYTRR